MYVVVGSSKELEDAIRAGKHALIGNGNYQLNLPDAVDFHVTGTGHAGLTKITCLQTVKMLDSCEGRNFTFALPADVAQRGAAVNMDRGAYTVLDHVMFDSPLSTQDHNESLEWNSFAHRGAGIQTTDQNNGDSSFNVTLTKCKFAFLEAGIDIRPPARKGTTMWVLNDCVFNACQFGVYADWIGRWNLWGGMIQLAQWGFDFCGSNNNLNKVHFERCGPARESTEGGADIRIRPISYSNWMDTDARVIIDESPVPVDDEDANGWRNRFRTVFSQNIDKRKPRF